MQFALKFNSVRKENAMKIRHISGIKIGTVEHIENQTGRTLIALGVAEEIKLPPRGSDGWLDARKELSDVPHGLGPRTSLATERS